MLYTNIAWKAIYKLYVKGYLLTLNERLFTNIHERLYTNTARNTTIFTNIAGKAIYKHCMKGYLQTLHERLYTNMTYERFIFLE